MVNEYRKKRTEVEKLFSKGKKLEKIIKETSPSGKYSLEISQYEMGKKGWDYSRGIIKKENKIIADVKRNYNHFPFCWVENHPQNHDYLICGEDYQGQTVIELDTGKRKDYIPEEAKEGFGFCWSEYKFDRTSLLMIVEGCIWACPYEFRFYDFSNPLNWGSEIQTKDNIYSDKKWPEIGLDGTIRCFETEDNDDNEDENNHIYGIEKSIKTFKREGNNLVLLNEWVSDGEQKSREERKKAEKEYKQWLEEFRTSDPLYLLYKQLLNDPKLNPDEYEFRGITHENWCPDFKKQETRWGRRIVQKKRGYTIDFEWAVKTGPIKLVIYKNGKHVEDKFFAHSTEAMGKAFIYIGSLID